MEENRLKWNETESSFIELYKKQEKERIQDITFEVVHSTLPENNNQLQLKEEYFEAKDNSVKMGAGLWVQLSQSVQNDMRVDGESITGIPISVFRTVEETEDFEVIEPLRIEQYARDTSKDNE